RSRGDRRSTPTAAGGCDATERCCHAAWRVRRITQPHGSETHQGQTHEAQGMGRLIMRRMLIVALLLAACGKKGPNELRLDQALKGVRSAGFNTDGLKQAAPNQFSALRCVTGSLEGLDANVCEYGSVEAVGAGKKALEAWAGHADTGVVLNNGFTILA